MLLKDYFPNLEKKYHKISFKGIAFNSNEVKEGYIFFAFKGNNTDGNFFIKDAIRNGSKIIISDKFKTNNWKNNINSSLRSSIIGDYLISISQEGYLIVTEKVSGNIIRVTDIFNNFKEKKRDNIDPTGFLVGLDKVYVSTNIGRLLIVDIESGKTISTLKIDNEKISKPFIQNNNLFLIKDNAIIKLN